MQTHTLDRVLNEELIKFERSPELVGLRPHYRPEWLHALFDSMADPHVLDREAFARFTVGKSELVLRIVIAFWRFRVRTKHQRVMTEVLTPPGTTRAGESIEANRTEH